MDLLVRRLDADRVTTVLESIGFVRENLRDIVLFLDPAEPSRKSGVHLVWAAERIRPSYTVLSPDITEAQADRKSVV